MQRSLFCVHPNTLWERSSVSLENGLGFGVGFFVAVLLLDGWGFVLAVCWVWVVWLVFFFGEGGVLLLFGWFECWILLVNELELEHLLCQ